MRIFTKKSFRFDHPQGRDAAEPVFTRALSFSDVPDWVAHSRMFELASSDGDVSVTESKSAEKFAEEEANTPKKGRKSQGEASE